MSKQLWRSAAVLTITTLGVVMAIPQSIYASEIKYDSVVPYLLAQSPWSIFTSETGRFAVRMPQQPNTTTDTDKLEGEPIEIYEFSTEANTNSYSVVYADLPDSYLSQGPETVLNELRDYIMDDIAEDLDRKTVRSLTASERKSPIGRFPGRRYRLGDDDFTIDMRLYLAGERAYLLLGADIDEAAVNRFISSFKLL